VFAELTKSKKGAEYIALFSYFGLQCERHPSVLVSNALLTCCSMDPRSCLFRSSPSHQCPHPVLGLYGQAVHRGPGFRLLTFELL
jgi:hypothetical protein